VRFEAKLRPFVSLTMLLIVLITILLLSGCGHPKQARVTVPSPPPPASSSEPAESLPPPPNVPAV
jgi:uncharacterized lipoprotein YajG